MKYQRVVDPKTQAVKYRAQPRDPVTKRRLNVQADTLEELRQRLDRIKQTADELRWGGLSPQEASQKIKPALASAPLNVSHLFEKYLKTLPKKSHKLAEQNWRSRLKSYFSSSLPGDLTRDVMAAWQQDLIRKGFASKTILNSYNHLAGCMRCAIDAGAITDLPWGSVSKFGGGTGWRPYPGIPQKQVQCVGSIEQTVALIMVAKKHDEAHWQADQYSAYAASVAAFILSGLRQAELCALAWDAVNIDNPPYMLQVTCQAGRAWNRSGASRPFEPTKTKKNRTQALHLTLVSVLRIQRAELKRRGWYRLDGPVFPGVAGAWRTSGRVIIPAKMKQFAKEAGFPRSEWWTVHSLRHSFASLEVKSSGDLKRTQERTGHSSLKQLEGYLHATGAFLGNTAIPEFSIGLEPVRTLDDGTQVVAAGNAPLLAARLSEGLVPADPWGFDYVAKAPDITLVAHAAAREYDRQVHDSSKALRDGSERKFSDIAREWVQSPERTRSGKPPEVGVAIHRNYCAAYAAEMRASKDKQKARRAAGFKARACKGAWARAVSIAEKALSAADTENPSSDP